MKAKDVYLTEAELQVVQLSADQADRKTFGAREWKGKGRGTHFQGFAAERAVAVLLGLSAMPSFQHGGDGRIDLRWGGLTIDVKWTSHRPPHLRFDSGGFLADVAVLCSGEPNPIHVWGWLTREEFGRLFQTRDYGYGTKQYVHGEKVHGWQTLTVDAVKAAQEGRALRRRGRSKPGIQQGTLF